MTNYPTFPQGAWQGLFQDYRQLVGPTTEAPDAFLWGSMAAAWSVLLGRAVRIPNTIDPISPVIHVALLGDTGVARKSSAVSDAVNIVVNPLKVILQGVPGEPCPVEVVNGSGSGEGFMEQLADRHWWPPSVQGKKTAANANIQTGRRALFTVAEFGGLLEKISRDQAGSMESFLLESFDAKDSWVHATRRREGADPLVVTRGAGVVCGCSTVEWLGDALTQAQVKIGLVNRFLWIVGAPQQHFIAFRGLADPTKRSTFEYQALAAYKTALTRGDYILDAKALALHEASYCFFRQQKRTSLMHAAVARSDVIALRLSIIICIACNDTMIREDHMRAAWAVTSFSNECVEWILSRVQTKEIGEAEDRILDRIHVVLAARKHPRNRDGSFTKKDIREGLTRMSSELFVRAWAALMLSEQIMEYGQTKAKTTGAILSILYHLTPDDADRQH